jgi:hypothetical protein
VRCSRSSAPLAPAALAAALLLAGACAGPLPYDVASKPAPDGARTAAVRLERCDSEWCQGLWIGANAGGETKVATLPPDAGGASEIAWSPDGKRVAVLVGGHQLRIYDAITGAPAGQLDLVPADATPTTRIARGVTFSDTGAAITYDDCPRDRSGCRPGIAAIR